MTKLDRQPGFCIIGAGDIGRVHAKAIEHLPEARLTVVSSRNAGRGRALAAPYGAIWVADWYEAIFSCRCMEGSLQAKRSVAPGRPGGLTAGGIDTWLNIVYTVRRKLN